mgnify:CR=1 FL=1
MTASLSPTQLQFIQLQQAIDRPRIAKLVEDQQRGQLSPADKNYYEGLISQFVALVQLPNAAHLAMQVLPEFKLTVPVLLDGMAYRALQDHDAKACVFAAYMIDQSLLERDLTPLFNAVLNYGTPELWVQLIKTVNNVPVEPIIKKVYASDKSVQDYWESQILVEDNGL